MAGRGGEWDSTLTTQGPRKWCNIPSLNIPDGSHDWTYS